MAKLTPAQVLRIIREGHANLRLGRFIARSKAR